MAVSNIAAELNSFTRLYGPQILKYQLSHPSQKKFIKTRLIKSGSFDFSPSFSTLISDAAPPLRPSFSHRNHLRVSRTSRAHLHSQVFEPAVSSAWNSLLIGFSLGLSKNIIYSERLSLKTLQSSSLDHLSCSIRTWIFYSFIQKHLRKF